MIKTESAEHHDENPMDTAENTVSSDRKEDSASKSKRTLSDEHKQKLREGREQWNKKRRMLAIQNREKQLTDWKKSVEAPSDSVEAESEGDSHTIHVKRPKPKKRKTIVYLSESTEDEPEVQVIRRKKPRTNVEVDRNVDVQEEEETESFYPQRYTNPKFMSPYQLHQRRLEQQRPIISSTSAFRRYR